MIIYITEDARDELHPTADDKPDPHPGRESYIPRKDFDGNKVGRTKVVSAHCALIISLIRIHIISWTGSATTPSPRTPLPVWSSMRRPVSVSHILAPYPVSTYIRSGMCELKRGKQFQHFASSESKMFAEGGRLPSGGALGDAYGHYAKFEVESIAGIRLAFASAVVRFLYSAFWQNSCMAGPHVSAVCCRLCLPRYGGAHEEGHRPSRPPGHQRA